MIHASGKVAPVYDHEEVEDGESQLVDRGSQPGWNGADGGKRGSGSCANQAERVNLGGTETATEQKACDKEEDSSRKFCYSRPYHAGGGYGA